MGLGLVRTDGFDFGFWILIQILDFDFDMTGFCSAKVRGVTEKLDGGGGGGGGEWLTEEEKQRVERSEKYFYIILKYGIVK